MEKTKNEMVADLYALRAGLSLIAQNGEACEKGKKEIERIEQDINYNKQQRIGIQGDISDIENKFRSEQAELRDRIKTCEEFALYYECKATPYKMRELKRKEYNFSYQKWHFVSAILVPGLLLGIITVLSMFFLLRENGVIEKNDYSWGSWGPLSLGCFSLWFIIFGVIVGFSQYNDKKETITKLAIIPWIFSIFYDMGQSLKISLHNKKEMRKKKEYDKKIENEQEERKIKTLKEREKYRNKAHTLRETLQEYERTQYSVLSGKKERLKSKILECDSQIERYSNQIAEQKSNIHKLNGKSKILYQKLCQTYGAIINESDWKNLDILIYYLQSNRADGIKEALQLMDRQKQTEQIIQMVGLATQSITETIDSTMQTLGEVLYKSFSVISGQLSDISGQLSNISYNQSVMIGEMRNLTNAMEGQRMATEMSNALMSKIHKTSEELYYDMKTNQSRW